MTDLDLRLVRYFTVVAEHGNFGRAAEALHVAQPSLSRQIQKLETQVGARLLDRTPHGSRLTDAGRAFLPHALTLLGTARRATAEAQASVGGPRFVVGYTGHLVITPVLRELRHRHPEAEVTPFHLEWNETPRAVLEHRVDVAVARLPVQPEGLEVTVLYEEARALVMPKSHRLAGRSSVALADFADEPLIRTSDTEWDRYWRLDPRPDGSPAPDGPRVHSIEDKFELVADGQALVMAPESAVIAAMHPELVAVPVRGLDPVPVVSVHRSGEDTPLIRSFHEVARACFAKPRLATVAG